MPAACVLAPTAKPGAQPWPASRQETVCRAGPTRTPAVVVLDGRLTMGNRRNVVLCSARVAGDKVFGRRAWSGRRAAAGSGYSGAGSEQREPGPPESQRTGVPACSLGMQE